MPKDFERGGGGGRDNIVPFPGRIEDDPSAFHRLAFDIMSKTNEFIDGHPDLKITNDEIEEKAAGLAALHANNIGELEDALETILREDGGRDDANPLEGKSKEEIQWRVAVASAYLKLHDKDRE